MGLKVKLFVVSFIQLATLWMWSGAHGSTHNNGARGPGFDP